MYVAFLGNCLGSLVEIWNICAIDLHQTTPDHDILWSQIVGWGWNTGIVELTSRFGRHGGPECMDSVMESSGILDRGLEVTSPSVLFFDLRSSEVVVHSRLGFIMRWMGQNMVDRLKGFLTAA